MSTARSRIRAGANALAAGTLAAALACCGSCGNSSSPAAEGVRLPAAEASATESPGVTWRAPIEVAAGDAFMGPWRMNESRFHLVDDPTVAITADGSIAVAWVDNRRQDVFFQRYDREGRPVFEEPVEVSRTPDVFSWLPRVVLSDDGREVFLLWQEIVFSGGSHGGDIFFARSTDGGRTFAEPLNLSRSQAGDGKGRLTRERWHNGSLDLARGADGTLHAAWTEYEGKLWFRRSTDGGEHFREPVHVAGTEDAPARAPDIAVGPGGSVYLAWAVGEDPAADLRLAASADGGASFGEPRVLFASDGHSDAPRIAVDTQGDLHLVYAESPSGHFGAYHVLHARLQNGERASAEPARLAGPEAGAVDSASFPEVSVSGEDDVLVIWERHPEGEQRPRGLGFTLSTDRGRTFRTPSIVPGTAEPEDGSSGGLQGLLMQKLAVNDDGAIAVGHSRFQRNEASRVRLVRGLLTR